MRKFIVTGTILLGLALNACDSDDGNSGNHQALQNYYTSIKDNNYWVDSLNDGLYRWITGWDNGMRGPDDGSTNYLQYTARPGDYLEFYYTAHHFDASKSNRLGKVFYSNDPRTFDSLANIDLTQNPPYDLTLWIQGPERVTLGKTSLIRGLTEGLEGCIAGDTMNLYMRSKKAYGSNPMYNIPADEPVAFRVIVTKVRNFVSGT